jgi:hypothetical protein
MNTILLRSGLHNSDNSNLKSQLVRIRPLLIVSFAVALAAIIGAYSLSLLTGAPLSDLTRDPTSVTHSKFYVGLLSNLGVMLWTAAATACFMGAFILSNDRRFHQSAIFLFSSGALSLILTLDDLFRIHETVLPRYFHISETLVIAGYLLLSLAYLAYFFRQILTTDYLLLILALLFLGLSMAIDKIIPFSDLETFMKIVSNFPASCFG